MTYSNVVAWFIVLTTAATLHANGVAEALGWKSTLSAKFPETVGFYTIGLAATVIGFAIGFTPSIRSSSWSGAPTSTGSSRSRSWP